MSKLYYINSEVALTSLICYFKQLGPNPNALVLFGNSIKHLIPFNDEHFLSIDLIKNFHIQNSDLFRVLFLSPAGNIDETFRDFRRLKTLGYEIEVLPKYEEWNGYDLQNQKTQKFDINEVIKYPEYKINANLLRNSYEKKTCLVTGAGGSIGSELVHKMIDLGFKKLVLLDNSEYNLYKLKEGLDNNYSNKVSFVIGDIRNQNKMERLFKLHQIDIVFHLAAYKHVHLMDCNPEEAFEVNVLGTKILIDLAVDYHCEKFVFISTDKAVEPSTIMGATKKLAAQYVLSKSVNSNTLVSIARFGNILQSKGSAVDKFNLQISSKEPVTLSNPKMKRFFLLLGDVTKFILDVGHFSVDKNYYVFDIKEQTKLTDLIHNLGILNGLPKGARPLTIQDQTINSGEKLIEVLYAKVEQPIKTANNQVTVVNPSVSNYDIITNEISRLNEIIINNTKQLTLKDFREFEPFNQTTQKV